MKVKPRTKSKTKRKPAGKGKPSEGIIYSTFTYKPNAKMSKELTEYFEAEEVRKKVAMKDLNELLFFVEGVLNHKGSIVRERPLEALRYGIGKVAESRKTANPPQ